MQEQTKKITLLSTLTALTVVGVFSLGCKPSPEKRAETATTLMRTMEKELLEVQKKQVDAFKVSPDADNTRLVLGDKFDGWSVSEKNLGTAEEALDQKIVTIQKDAKDEALIGEYRIWIKGVSKNAQENLPVNENKLLKFQKMLDQNQMILDNGAKVALDDNSRKIYSSLVKVVPAEIEIGKGYMKVADAYVAKLDELLK